MVYRLRLWDFEVESESWSWNWEPWRLNLGALELKLKALELNLRALRLKLSRWGWNWSRISKNVKNAHVLFIFSIWFGKTCSWLEAFHGHRLSWKGVRRAVFLPKSSKHTYVFDAFAHPARGHPLRERDSLSLWTLSDSYMTAAWLNLGREQLSPETPTRLHVPVARWRIWANLSKSKHIYANLMKKLTKSE